MIRGGARPRIPGAQERGRGSPVASRVATSRDKPSPPLEVGAATIWSAITKVPSMSITNNPGANPAAQIWVAAIRARNASGKATSVGHPVGVEPRCQKDPGGAARP
jgi:hypothetical protein